MQTFGFGETGADKFGDMRHTKNRVRGVVGVGGLCLYYYIVLLLPALLHAGARLIADCYFKAFVGAGARTTQVLICVVWKAEGGRSHSPISF